MQRVHFRLTILFVSSLFAFPGAFAHTHLEKSSPANGSTLSKAPTELVLTFEEDVQVTAVSIETGDHVKQDMKLIPVTAKSISLPLHALNPGAYTVNWRALGDDGHVMTGHFSFTIAASK